MEFIFNKMKQSSAIEIADTWKYNDEYAFYNIDADIEDYEEFIKPELRKDMYYEVLNNESIVSFLIIDLIEDVCDIGIGLHPELTGRGIGYRFMLECIDFIKKTYPNIKKITLSVATFNKRAIKVYKKIGFKENNIYDQYTNGKYYEFLSMYMDFTSS